MATRLIDLHCDTLDRCLDEGIGLTGSGLHFNIANRPEDLHICQTMAIFIDSALPLDKARARLFAGYELYRREVCAHTERLCVACDLCDIPCLLSGNPIAVFLAVEGGSVIGKEPSWVDRLCEMSVKLLTITWNGENELCGGVGSEKGFTDIGKQVIARMEENGMLVDASHMNDKSFWDLCEFATKPFCASHSNARSICNHPRNLTDDQFKEIVRRGGVVGLNYYHNFIVDGGETQCMDDLLRHLHHFLELGGEDTVALGSDFDGAVVPHYIEGIEKLPALAGAIERQVGKIVAEKVLFKNAARFLRGM
ncbi:MAG: membrane dipeptidase [Oscillospiraceae bacterium]|nr:membrane dipeptidase [Oscillospiraceae bacterium]